MTAPAQIKAIDPGGEAKAEGEREELEKDPKGNAGASFQETPKRKGDEKVAMKTAIVATDRWASARASIR